MKGIGFGTIVLVILSTVQPSPPGFAAERDALKERLPEMESEIRRGSDAGLDCYIRNTRIGSDGVNCIRAVIARNREHRTDTDAFLLGIYFRGWLVYRIYDENKSGEMLMKKMNEDIDYRQVVNTTRRYFRKYREIQERLRIDDETLCEYANTGYEAIENDLKAWRRRQAIDSNFFDVK